MEVVANQCVWIENCSESEQQGKGKIPFEVFRTQTCRPTVMVMHRTSQQVLRNGKTYEIITFEWPLSCLHSYVTLDVHENACTPETCDTLPQPNVNIYAYNVTNTYLGRRKVSEKVKGISQKKKK